MGNGFFKFKEFVVYQNRCAMKVCTDACLFGALLPSIETSTGNVLDIGAGTGLLSLMYAQLNPQCTIHSVEIDDAAYKQAAENITASIWEDKIQVFHQSIQQFANEASKRYDLIFSNPPFFYNDLKGQDSSRNMAMHATHLSFEELLESANKLLTNKGIFCVLLPFKSEPNSVKLASDAGLYLYKCIRVKQTPVHDFFRSILFFKKEQQLVDISELTIKESTNAYSIKFSQLLQPYYLYL